MLSFAPKSLIRFAAILLVTTCFCSVEAQVPNKSPAATKFSRINEVVEKWTPDRHLFVKGDLGVGAVQLDELESWLDTNAPHWVIVLLNNANGETYSGADGHTYIGMDAVEHALGKGLTNRTDFGKFTHPQTGELDGTVFVLFLKERKFSYFASDAQSRRNLGDGNWIGQLDQPAVRAMRSGGRVVDAVKETVKSIDQQLARKISSEKADAERVQAELARALESLKSSAAHTLTQIDDVKMAAAEFVQKRSAAKGPLVHPPLEKWREELATIQAEANTENVRDLQQRLAKLDDAISIYLNGYAEVSGLETQVKQLNSKVKLVAKTSAAESAIADAKKALEQAESLADSGEFGIADVLHKADAAIATGESIVASEQARIEREQLVRSWIRRTIVIMLVLVALMIAAIFVDIESTATRYYAKGVSDPR